jgi:hypothetical protein
VAVPHREVGELGRAALVKQEIPGPPIAAAIGFRVATVTALSASAVWLVVGERIAGAIWHTLADQR